MSNFKVGQEVVCIKEGKWNNKNNINMPKHPYYGCIYTIVLILENGYLTFNEFPKAAYNYEEFRPLDYAFVEEVIKQVQPETVEL